MPPAPPARTLLLPRRRWLLGLAASGLAPAATACTPIRLPVAPGGLLVREEQGQAQGVPVTLGQALQRRLHCPVSTELMPQQRLIKAFYEDFEADVLIPGLPQPFGDHSPHFVPLFKVAAHLVAASARRWRNQDVPALLDRGGRAALPLHVTYGPGYNALAQRLEAQGRLSWVRDVGTALRMVAAQRVEFTLLSPTVAYANVGAAGYREYRFLPLTQLEPLETGAAVSQRSLPADTQARVVAALRAMAKEGDVAEAFARHFPPEVLEMERPAVLSTLRR
ncbi:hypothetical protein [Inhella sp.]|uniref:hypothetical protein n=1 Tax=Inhella sp. TaxID=1921806 RepID=UPI0035AE8397